MKIDKIYVINLQSSVDRWNYVSKMALNANITIERFNAVNGKELSKNDPIIKQYFHRYNHLKPSEWGCALSHIKIWEDAIKNNYKNIIVFEDDIIIKNDFMEQFNLYSSSFPENYGIIYLGGSNLKGKSYNEYLLKPVRGRNYGTFGMLYNINYVTKLLNDINKYKKIRYAIDKWLKKTYMYKKSDQIYFLKNEIVLHNYDLYSTILDRNYNISETNRYIKN